MFDIGFKHHLKHAMSPCLIKFSSLLCLPNKLCNFPMTEQMGSPVSVHPDMFTVVLISLPPTVSNVLLPL